MQYTKEQQKAINSIDKNLQIIACAGSGKTEVISARIVEILSKKKKFGIGPENIVAFTFTDKAAGELKDRIHRLCKERLGTDHGLAEMYIGTIHSYCLNLLQSPPVYKYLKYDVLTDVQQRLFIDRHSKKSGLSSTPLLKGGYLERWKDSKLYQQLIGIITEGAVNLKKIPKGIKTALAEYDNLLEEKKYFDYSKIIATAVKELQKNKELREIIEKKIKYLVVDEYQDINPLQEKLIKIIHDLGAILCVVGDDDQTIYQWRGSDVDNIIHFIDRYPKVETVPLEKNFRSSKGIVESAVGVIKKNSDRISKKMFSTNAQNYERGNILALNFENPSDEASWISDKIKSLIGTSYKDKIDSEPRGLTYSDFSVLLRSVRNDGDVVISALEKAHIPFIIGGMNNLFKTREIDIVKHVFYFLADYAEKGSLKTTKSILHQLLEDSPFGLSKKNVNDGMKYLETVKKIIGNEMKAELYLQRVYLDFLAALELREENINKIEKGNRTGEIIFYNLGKFSQIISDYEQINFNTEPNQLYPAFAGFLHYEAPGYYPEGWLEENGIKPDAVQVMTVHQAKGMQWPAVFIPCLRQNRFPSGHHGGRTIWHIIPEDAVEKSERYKGTKEDERRLFYVALTRAEKYLFCSWAPIETNRQQKKISDFFKEFTSCEDVLTKEPKNKKIDTITSRRRYDDQLLTLTFSELKYYFECPYLFKLRFLYGFDSPVSRAMGYGRSLHNALAEIHAESLKGNIPSSSEVTRLVDDHLHLPFANKQIEEHLTKTAKKSLALYLDEHKQNLSRLEHVEKVIELKLSDGIVVGGRIDLIRRTDTGEIVIVDFKSDERAQADDITQRQLHVYAVGYQQLTGKRADLIEVHNLDKGGTKREQIDEEMMNSTKDLVVAAGTKLKENDLTRLVRWCDTCERCDNAGICRQKANKNSK